MGLDGVTMQRGFYNSIGAILTRRKVFVSYHHANDQLYRNAFENFFAINHGIFISKSVQIGDIDIGNNTDTIRQKIRDEYLSDSTVTVVLIGKETWQRKHVDWEISSSIRETKNSTRSGLLGITLPTHPNYNQPTYTPGIVPPRLANNEANGYANIYNWSNNPADVAQWIETAFQNRNIKTPDNSYPHFVNNKFGNSWA